MPKIEIIPGESCRHPRKELLTTEGGGELGLRCLSCLAIWGMRSCSHCGASLMLRDRRGVRKVRYCGDKCRELAAKERRHAAEATT